MKNTIKSHVRAPYPKKARALLSLFCQLEGLECLPGYSLSPSQLDCPSKFDGQNNLLARGVAFYMLTGGGLKPLVNQRKNYSHSYDQMVCELFALGFTYREFNRGPKEALILDIEADPCWSDFDIQIHKRLGFRVAAEMQVSKLRESFFRRIEEPKAA